MNKLDENFIKWACSFSGCGGGNRDAKIWVSGIEWGLKDSYEYYAKNLPAEIKVGEYSPPTTNHSWEEALTYPYGRSLAKLYLAIIGEKKLHYKEVSRVSDGSEIFRTNLYPIAFNSAKSELWKQNGLDVITGFNEKNLFKTWCFLNRFPAISKIVEEESPKLIIGTGVNYLTDFFVCYAGSLNSDNIINVGELKTKKRKYYWARIGENTTLVVTPFFSSQSGLNSNELLQEMGEKIRELVPNL